MSEKPVDDESIRLDQLLKVSGLAQTGGHAKMVIQGGEVVVNGEIETRRRRKLFAGDKIEYNGEVVVIDEGDSGSERAEESSPERS
ncbi:RNA-binding S4 domain-containing protein [Planctomycetaceae bacterium]|nr:RNA-binding S4 domain-containing protein [Planctomycetaceae bacterium]MDG2391805.1 RNA-binding S4 domain-containing protein [Planctomycetaceae bacterium]